MLERDRDGDASVLDRVVGGAAGRLLAPSPSRGSSNTLRAAEGLVHRGDHAGARLLLRAVARVAPDQVLDEAAERLRPLGATRHLVEVAASMVLAIGLFAGGVVAAVISGADVVAVTLLQGSVGLALVARIAWVHYARLPGLTLQESRLWRSLGVLRRGDINDLATLGDGHLRRATTDIGARYAQRHPSTAEKPDNSGWVGLAGVIGAVVFPVFSLAIPTFRDGAWLAFMPVGAVVGALAMWAVLRSLANGPGDSPSRHDVSG